MHLHLYKNNPTAGTADGTLVSENTNANPLVIGPLLNAESGPVTLALRCDAGYATTGDAVVDPDGDTANKWALSLDGEAWGEYGASLTVPGPIDDTNTLFYGKAKTLSSESAGNDISVKLILSAVTVEVV